MAVLITYDVSGEQEKVKAGMLELHYVDKVDASNTIDSSPMICYLPDTTLYKENTTSHQAIEDLKAVVGAIPTIFIKRCFATEVVNWVACAGFPHKDTI